MATTGARRHGPARRIALTAALLVVAFLGGILGAAALSSALSAPSQTVGWMLSGGIGGPRFDPAQAQTTSVVNVEVQWPACVETGDHSWLRSDVSYTPWSVTITLHTSDAYSHNPKCHTASAGGLPMVGYYLSALSFPVQLSEPLAGRALSDGSQFPAAARPYR